MSEEKKQRAIYFFPGIATGAGIVSAAVWLTAGIDGPYNFSSLDSLVEGEKVIVEGAPLASRDDGLILTQNGTVFFVERHGYIGRNKIYTDFKAAREAFEAEKADGDDDFVTVFGTVEDSVTIKGTHVLIDNTMYPIH